MSVAEQEEVQTEQEPEPVEQPDEEEVEGEPESDDGDNAESEPAPETVPAPEVEDKMIERVTASLEKEAARHEKRIAEIMGDEAGMLERCVRCWDKTPGFHFPHTIVPVVGPQLEALYESIGLNAPVTLKAAEDATQCSKCGGYGKVNTGSLVASQREVKCYECDGRGWVGALLGKIRNAGDTALAVVADTNGHVDEPAPDTDPWGRHKTDPNYGRMPGFEV